MASTYFLVSVIAPESRLSPCEPLYSSLLLLLFYYLISLSRQNWMLKDLSPISRFGFYFTFTLITTIKEIAVIPTTFIIVLLIWRRNRNPGTIYILLLACWTYIKVGYPAFFLPKTSYGSVATPQLDHLLAGIKLSLGALSNSYTNPKISLMMFILVLSASLMPAWTMIKKKKYPSLLMSCVFLLLVGHLAFFLIWKIHSMRYLSPSLVLAAILIYCWIRHTSKGILYKSIWITVMVFYFALGAYPMLYKYSSQYYTRNLETNLLEKLDNFNDKGGQIRLVTGSEFESKIQLYFSDFRPMMLNKNPSLVKNYSSGDELVGPMVIPTRIDKKQIYSLTGILPDRSERVPFQLTPWPFSNKVLHLSAYVYYEVLKSDTIKPLIDFGAPRDWHNIWYLHYFSQRP